MQTPLGKLQDRLEPCDAPDLSLFDDDELATMRSVLDEFRDATGTQLSELSHEEPGWRLTELGETIPLAACLLVTRPAVSPALAAHGAELAASLRLH